MEAASPRPENPGPATAAGLSTDGHLIPQEGQSNSSTTETSTETHQISFHQLPQSDEICHRTELANSARELLHSPKPDSSFREPRSVSVPYSIPTWSQPPCHPYFLEVLKDGSIIGQFDVSRKGAYMFGRVDLCDFVLEHPTISRFHAVLQFKGNGDACLYDLGSTHGTFVNKVQITKKVYIEMHVGDTIRFGQSSRLYIFQGPYELMPPEGDLTVLRNKRMREEMQDRDASLLRAKAEASLVDGISWGMIEDAISEVKEDTQEITWQTYEGQLTEKQGKTRAKILRRIEKVTNMKKEINAIRAKDISQGGLTQGQQTQIARNEQRISQMMEELENLEETLNESIQESVGARAGKAVFGKKTGDAEDEDEILSDDDEYYDRTKRPVSEAGDCQTVETAASLLEKRDAITQKMEERRSFFLRDNVHAMPQTDVKTESSDSLDIFMTGVSSVLAHDAAAQLERELSLLQSELDRVNYLLKIADPTGEMIQLRMSDGPLAGSNEPNKCLLEKTKGTQREENGYTVLKPADMSFTDNKLDAVSKGPATIDERDDASKKEEKAESYSIAKPLWLGANQYAEVRDSPPVETPLDLPSDVFVDYKDRKRVFATIEEAGPGLILRKSKHLDDKDLEQGKMLSTLSEAESTVANAVALLLKHEHGYSGLEGGKEDEHQSRERKYEWSVKEGPRSGRVLGPERPSFLERSSSDYEGWMPPEGQSGDGRTLLNEKFGY